MARRIVYECDCCGKECPDGVKEAFLQLQETGDVIAAEHTADLCRACFDKIDRAVEDLIGVMRSRGAKKL